MGYDPSDDQGVAGCIGQANTFLCAFSIIGETKITDEYGKKAGDSAWGRGICALKLDSHGNVVWQVAVGTSTICDTCDNIAEVSQDTIHLSVWSPHGWDSGCDNAEPYDKDRYDGKFTIKR
jgi:hypothetical protein